MTQKKRILVTSALPYANGPLHIGHLAGAYLPADLYTRFQRMAGRDVVHICGSDEHGVPILIAAEKQGTTPQAIVDRFHEMNSETFKRFGIDFDHYGRTSSETHRQTATEFFLALERKGIFKKKTESQLFDPEAGMFLPDRYVKGTCPSCGHPEAYGDQCEKCGTSLSPSDLVNPVSALTGNVPETRQTDHWYLPLGDYQQALSQWIDSHPEWKSNVLGQVRSWLHAGLSDRAVTRDLRWGVPVPLPDAEGKVLYVWFDAPIGYISSTKEWAASQGDPDRWTSYWCDEGTDLIHFIGKDNIVFHCIIFPVMLRAHGGFIQPTNVPANEFLNLEGRKISTSRNWAIWLHELADQVDPDLIRYVISTILPETKDADFTWSEFQIRVNTELADILGNFLFRTQSFLERFFEGVVPPLQQPDARTREVLSLIAVQRDRIAEAYGQFRFKEAVGLTMELAREGNRYFTEMEPWKARKEDPVRCANALHACSQISAALSVLFSPVMPERMAKLRAQLGLPASPAWTDADSQMLSSGSVWRSGDVLFPKVEDEFIQQQMARLGGAATPEDATKGSSTTNSAGSERDLEPIKQEITFPDFANVDIRAGRIVHAEAMPKSEKLLKLTVDIGLEHRTILSGIAKHFTPEALIGKTVPVVVNLAPRPMMGIESQGMVLLAESTDGTLHLMETGAEPGSTIR